MSKNDEWVLSGDQAIPLMQQLSLWGKTTTIVLHGGCVFEFKGAFPTGSVSEGFYNLDSQGKGFEGHIHYKSIHQVRLQSKTHRGRESHAFVFENDQGLCLFKVFLGRHADGQLIEEQVKAFEQIKINQNIDCLSQEAAHEK